MIASALPASPVASSVQPSASKVWTVLSSPVFWLAAVSVVTPPFDAELTYTANVNEGGGSGLLWEDPIAKLIQSINGPVIFGIALFGTAVCGATLIWGGEVSEFTRRVTCVVLVTCIIVLIKDLSTGAMFSGTVIPANVSITADGVATAQQGAGGH